jgi:hypothetical protein
LLVHGGVDLMAIQDKERFHGGMADPLVPVDERVIPDE